MKKIATLFIALFLLIWSFGCGAATGDPSIETSSDKLTAEDVRRALRGLPFRYTLRRIRGPEGNDASFRGRIYGRHDTTVRFSIGIGDPPKPVSIPGVGVRRVIWEEGAGFAFNDDGPLLSKEATVGEWEEIVTMSVEVQERLCKAATGKPCPV